MAQTLIFVEQGDTTGANPLGEITLDNGVITEKTGVAIELLKTVQMLGSNDEQAFGYFSNNWSNGGLLAFPKPE
jgi:hypothetical protein